MTNETLTVKFQADTTGLNRGIKNTKKAMFGLKKTAQGVGLDKAFNSRAAAQELDQLSRQIQLNQRKLEQYTQRQKQLQHILANPPKADTRSQEAEMDRLISKVDNVNARLETIRAKLADSVRFPSMSKSEKQVKELEKLRSEEIRLVDVSERTVEQINKLEAAIQSAKLNNPTVQAARKEYEQLQQDILRVEKNSTTAQKRIQSINASMNQTGKAGNRMASGLRRASTETRRLQKQSTKLKTPLRGISSAFMQAAKRIFLLSVAYKALRGAAQYLTAALKTNKQFTDSLNAVKVNLATAFQPIYEAILPALNSLMSALAKATRYVASFISALFGKSYNQSKQAAAELNQAKDAMEGYGGAAEKARGQLASFDKFNDITPQSDSGGGGGSSSVDFSQVEDVSPAWLEPVTAALGKLKELLAPTIDELHKLWEVLQMVGGFAWQGIEGFYERFLLPVGGWVFGEDSGLARFVRIIREGLIEIEWTTIIESFNNLWDALALFTTTVGDGLLWFLDNVLRPLGTWTMNVAVPEFLDLLTSAIKTVTTAIDALKPGALFLLDHFLKPISEWTGGVIIDVLEMLRETFDKLRVWIEENGEKINNVFTKIGEVMDLVWNKVLEPVLSDLWTGFKKIFGWVVDLILAVASDVLDILDGVLDFVIGIFTGDWERAWDGVGKIVDGVVNVVTSLFNGFLDFLDMIFQGKLSGIIEVIRNTFGGFVDGVKQIFSGITEFLAGVFTGDWERAWEGVKSIFSGIFNAVISIFEGAVNGIIAGINWLIGKINTISIDLPDWDILGKWAGETLGFNLKKITEVSLPRLAKGGLAYGQVQAIVGDNFNAQQNPEVISPLKDLQQMITSAMLQRDIATGSSQPIEVKMVVEDGTTLVHMLIDPMNKTAKNLGYAPVFKPA